MVALMAQVVQQVIDAMRLVLWLHSVALKDICWSVRRASCVQKLDFGAIHRRFVSKILFLFSFALSICVYKTFPRIYT